MPPGVPLPPSEAPQRGSGTELWLLCAGPPETRERSLRAFAGARPALVLGPSAGIAAEWAAALGARAGAPVERHDSLAPVSGAGPDELGRRAWPVIERALGRGHARLLAALEGEVLRSLVAQALELPPERAHALRVDPGRAVLLRDDRIGIVLRRSNVCAPEEEPGTALPAGAPEGTP